MGKLVVKRIIVDGVEGLFQYESDLIGKEPNDIGVKCLAGASVQLDNGETYELYVNGADYYNEDTEEYEPDYYYEVDGDSLSDIVYERIDSSDMLLDMLMFNRKIFV